MLKRNSYAEAEESTVSMSNEPFIDLHLDASARRYPDMCKAYEGFSKFFGIPASQFILGNGCENAMKSILLALKPKSIHWSKPSWGFVDVYAAQLECQSCVHAYEGDLASGFNDEDFAEGIDVYYATMHANNFIPTSVNAKNVEKSRYSVVDLSYLQVDQLKEVLSCRVDSKVIYVGSFDKLLGCGLRAGFAVFSEALSDAIQLQRENYVNALAAKVFQNLDRYCKVADDASSLKSWHLDSLHLECPVFATSNYIVVQSSQNISFPCKRIIINGITYSRYGMPSDKKTMQDLLLALSKLKIDQTQQ